VASIETIGTASEAAMQKIRIELGRRIRELRKMRGWSQEKLGEIADLHPTYVGGIERGERNVAFENLVHIASAFGLSLSQFFDYQKGSQSRRDAVKADLISSLQKRDEGELKLLSDVLKAFDECRKTIRK
jgi:transcriptional regulator with XRE-family HTH domain